MNEFTDVPIWHITNRQRAVGFTLTIHQGSVLRARLWRPTSRMVLRAGNRRFNELLREWHKAGHPAEWRQS